MYDNLARQLDCWEEKLNGQIIFMSPRPAVNHNLIISNVHNFFYNYLIGKNCISFADGTDVFLTEKDRVIPDVMIVCDRDKIKPDGVHGAPDLVVEVLSPRTAKRDHGYKKDLYESCGVREYWIIDPESRRVYVHLLRDGKFILDEVYEVLPEYVRLTEEEAAEYRADIPVSLYDDLAVPLDHIFSNLF